MVKKNEKVLSFQNQTSLLHDSFEGMVSTTNITCSCYSLTSMDPFLNNDVMSCHYELIMCFSDKLVL